MSRLEPTRLFGLADDAVRADEVEGGRGAVADEMREAFARVAEPLDHGVGFDGGQRRDDLPVGAPRCPPADLGALEHDRVAPALGEMKRGGEPGKSAADDRDVDVEAPLQRRRGMEPELAGKVAWVTGAGSGIGRAMALAFARAGDRVAITGRGQPALEEVARKIEVLGTGEALVLEGDVRDRARMDACVAAVLAAHGRLDILCANAGLNNPARHWANPDFEEWDGVIDVNVKWLVASVAPALATMRAQGDGLVIVTACWAGRFHAPVAGVPYGAAKHAALSIAASLNAEENVNGICATALCPGEVPTPLLARRPSFDPSRAGRMIQPEDMALAALFVARMNPNVAIHEIVLARIDRSDRTRGASP